MCNDNKIQNSLNIKKEIPKNNNDENQNNIKPELNIIKINKQKGKDWLLLNDNKKPFEKYLQNFEIQDSFFDLQTKDNISNNYKENIKNYLISFLNKKKYDFIKNIDEVYLNKKIPFEEKIIKNILKKENISSIYDKIIEKEINLLNKDINKLFKIDYITILVTGRCGTGKSTLINAMLKEVIYDSFFIRRWKLKEYRGKNELSYLNMIEDRGWGLRYNYFFLMEQINNIIKEMKIESKRNNDYNENIQCIYYCISGSHLYEEEIEVIKMLKNNNESIPVIIVYTMGINKTLNEMMEKFIKSKLKFNLPFINVLAKRCELIGSKFIDSYGLNDLLKITLDECKKCANIDILNIIKENIYENVRIKILELTKNIKFNIINNMLEKFMDYKKVIKENELHQLIYRYIELGFIEYIKLIKNDNIELNEETKNELKKLNSLNEFIKEYIEYNKNHTKIFIESILDDASSEFLDMQIKTEENFSHALQKENRVGVQTIKKIIRNFFEKNFDYISQKYLIYKLIYEYCEYFMEILKKAVNEIIIKNFGKKQTMDLIKKAYDIIYGEFRLSVYKKFINGKIYEENDDE